MAIDKQALAAGRQFQHTVNDATINAHVNDYGVDMQSDIPYINDGSADHLLDIYSPADADKTQMLPVVILIHGGGYSSGFKELDRRLGQLIATHGFRVVNINYSLMPEVGFGQELREIMTVANWISDHRVQYGFADQNISIMGDSSAGHLTLLAAATQNNQALQNYFEVTPYAKNFKAYVAICPATFESITSSDNVIIAGVRQVLSDWLSQEDFVKHALYTNYMADNFPEVMIVTTPSDSILAEQAIAMHDFMTANQIKHVYKSYEGVENKIDHVFNVLFPEYEESQRANADIVAYLKDKNA